MYNDLSGTRALLLAGGVGSRLQPITQITPKCLVKIGDRPLLEFWLQSLFDAGIDRILINTHYLAEQVVNFCKKSRYSRLIDLVHEPKLLGTAGTLRANRHLFNGNILFAHADNFSLFDPKALMRAHNTRTSGCEATMMTFTTDNPSSCGIVEIDSNGVLINFHEKLPCPPGNTANAAVFILGQASLNWLDLRPKAIDFCAEIVPLGLGKIQTYHTPFYHRDIGTISSLNQANQDYFNLIKNQ